MRKSADGLFILIEGGDGTGKDTLGENLKNLLEESGSGVLMVSEPNEGLASGRTIRAMLRREIPKPETPLGLQEEFVKHRAEHFVAVVAPALKEDKTVISVRSYPSTFAYGMLQGGVGVDAIRDLHEKHLGEDMIHADLIFYIQVDPEVALSRQGKTGKKEEIFDDIEKQRQVMTAYEVVLREEPFITANSSVVFLNGEKSAEEVAQAAFGHLSFMHT